MHQDRSRVERLFRPIEHKFTLDLEAAASFGFRSYTEDIGDLAEIGNATELASFISSKSEKEHFVNGALALAIALPRFKLWNTKFTPSLRGSAEIGSSLAATIRPGVITLGSFTASAIDPKLSVYLRQDIKIGLNFDWEYSRNHYGLVSLYNFNRWDREEAISKDDINESDEVLDLDQPKNTSRNLAMDLKYGFRGHNFTIMAAIEEIKLAAISDKTGLPDVNNEGALHNLSLIHI